MKQFTGTITSTKMMDTAIVKVVRRWTHPVYKKIVSTSKNYACDTKGIEVKDGEMVVIQETKPISKTKRFKVVEIVK